MRTLIRPTLGRFMTTVCFLACASSAFADVTWDAVKKKVADGKSYQVDYKYDGPKGQFKFDYRSVVPGKIRSEIKESKSDSSKVGTVVVYDADWNKDKVRAKSGGGLVTRNTTHKDVEDTPFIEPVFNLILRQCGGGSPKTISEGDKTRFEFKTGSGTYAVWANGSGEIVKSERIDKRVKEVREFSNIRWNSNPDCSL